MPVETIEEITEFDVVFGRGGAKNQLRQTSFFRKAILKHWESYCELPTHEKRKWDFVSRKFIDPIEKKGGRFLYRKGGAEKGTWKELHPCDFFDRKQIYKKICQSLRDVKKEYIRKGAAAVAASKKDGDSASSTPGATKTKATVTTTTNELGSPGKANGASPSSVASIATPQTVTAAAIVSPPVTPPDSRRSSFHEANSKPKKMKTDDFIDEDVFTVDTLVTLEDARNILQEFDLEEDFPTLDSSSLETVDSDTIHDFFTNDMDYEMSCLLSIENKMLDIVAATNKVICDADNCLRKNSFAGNSGFSNKKCYVEDFSFYEVVANS